MIAIKITGPSLGSTEEAADTLAGLEAVGGFMFAFITRDNRIVSFTADVPGELPRGAERVTVSLPS